MSSPCYRHWEEDNDGTVNVLPSKGEDNHGTVNILPVQAVLRGEDNQGAVVVSPLEGRTFTVPSLSSPQWR